MSWYLLAAIPVFGVLVLGHEFGHFITAKWAGIRVEEFGIGFPPRMIGVKRGETIYSINWLPIGGFVRMPGENGETTTEDGAYDPGAFASKPASKRAIVLVAGVTMNLILAFVLFVAAELSGTPQLRAAVGVVEPSSPAAAAGIQTGDTILRIDGQPTKYWSDVTSELMTLDAPIPASQNTFSVTVTVQHAHASTPQTLVIQARAHPSPNEGYLGIGVDESNPYVQHIPVVQVPGKAADDMRFVVVGTVQGIAQIVTGQLPWNKALTGPVGIVKDTGTVASTVAQIGPHDLLYWTAALSLSLAFVNILPIPALDGGRLMFIGLEILRRGKRLSAEHEALVNLLGMAALLGLMAIVTINDVGTIVAGH